jgi:hypothetical protein
MPFILFLFSLVTAADYSEHLYLLPYTKSTSLAVFTFTFSWNSTNFLLTNFDLFPRVIPTVLGSAHADYFQLTLTQGQIRPEADYALALLAEKAVVDFSTKESGVTMRTEETADWERLTGLLGVLVCSPVRALKPIKMVNGDLYVHAHDFNCKENLGNVIKLLPCRDARGLGQLLTDSLYEHGYMHISHAAKRSKNEYFYTIEVMTEVPSMSPFKPKAQQACLLSEVTHFSPSLSLIHESFSDIQFSAIDFPVLNPSGKCVKLTSERRLGGDMHSFEAWYEHKVGNCFADELDVTVTEYFPEQLTPMLHTLITSGTWTIAKLSQGWILTICAHLNQGKTLQIKLRLVKHMQQFESYPTDPQRGWDVPSTPLRYYFTDRNLGREQPTSRLLVMIPEPDFSMPFNVMCITGTLISFFFTTLQTFTLWKEPTHWSSPRYEDEVVKAERFKTRVSQAFFICSIGTVLALDHYGVVKLW